MGETLKPTEQRHEKTREVITNEVRRLVHRDSQFLDEDDDDDDDDDDPHCI